MLKDLDSNIIKFTDSEIHRTEFLRFLKNGTPSDIKRLRDPVNTYALKPSTKHIVGYQFCSLILNIPDVEKLMSEMETLWTPPFKHEQWKSFPTLMLEYNIIDGQLGTWTRYFGTNAQNETETHYLK